MSKLEELIQQYCPDGVEYKEVQEVAKTTSPKGKLKSNDYLKEGKYPVIDQGQSFIGGYTNEEIAFSEGEYVIFGDHTCVVKYVNFAFVQGADGVKVITANDVILPRFLYYCMSNIYMPADYARHWSKMKVEKIPVPPLPVQEEIVRILDTYTELQAELQAELQKRLQQYNYYRDNLLSFEGRTDIEWKRLGDVATLIRGGNFQKKDFTEIGVPCIHYGQIYTHFGIHTTSTIKYISPEVASKSKIAKTNDIVMAITSENVDDVGKCVAWLGDEDIAVSGHTAIIQHKQNAKYLSYYFHTSHFFTQKKKLAHGTKVIEISPKDLANVIVPIPSLEEQQRIVDILDRFDTLTNDLSQGLPAEIEARRKQYEYYRDQLLTFKKKA